MKAPYLNTCDQTGSVSELPVASGQLPSYQQLLDIAIDLSFPASDSPAISACSRCADEPFTFAFFFQAEDGIRDDLVTGVQTCVLPICCSNRLEQLQQQIAELRGQMEALSHQF